MVNNENLSDAKKLYSQKKYCESLNIYEKLYAENPDSFNKGNLISYCWAIYHVRVKNFTDEDELYDAVELITDLIPQADLNRTNICPYTFSVFKVLDYLIDKKEYYNLSEWLDLLDPNLLDDNDSKFKKSRRQFYYEYASKSYLACAEWDLCIEISKEALNSIKTFTKDGDIWHKWRIAKAYKELKQNEDAIRYLNEINKTKTDWFIFKEFAENYHALNDTQNAITYIRKAILADGPEKMKVNLYCLAYKLLEEINPEIAYRHAELCYILKLENRSQIPDELEDLMIEKDELNKTQLINEINAYWLNFENNL